MVTGSELSLIKKYPPSEPCSCDICKSYCRRPGWWSVNEATNAISAGYGSRMMLEISPDFSFGVLSPAFKGCENNFALQEYSSFGCTFLSVKGCELHGKGLQPLECRFCHHSRIGSGLKCHTDLEHDWKTYKGQILVKEWINSSRLFTRYGINP